MTIASRAVRALGVPALSSVLTLLYVSHAHAMALTGPPTATSHPVEYCADRDSDERYDPSDCTFWPVESSEPDDLYDLASKTIYRKKSRNIPDNCPRDFNSDQSDVDGDGVGDVCEYLDLSVGANHACAMRNDGTVGCWGDNTFGQSSAPIFRFSAIAVGRNHSCGLLNGTLDSQDGKVLCWGDNRFNQLGAKNGQFVRIYANGDVSCAVDKNGAAKCWGGCGSDETCQPDNSTAWYSMIPAFDVTPAESDTPQSGMCGVATSPTYALTCFGGRPPVQTPAGRFGIFEGGDHYGCALPMGSPQIQCWGRSPQDPADPPDPMLAPPTTPHAMFSVGLDHACAISFDRSQIHCWGSNASGKSTPPANLTGPFEQISVGDQHACVRKTNGQVACWGDTGVTSGDPFGRDAHNKLLPTAPLYMDLSANEYVGCGTTFNGDVSCASIAQPGYISPPGKFSETWVGEGKSCGMRQDNTAVCWDGAGHSEEFPGVHRIATRRYYMDANGDGTPEAREYLCGIFTNSKKIFCRDQGQATPSDAGTSFGPNFDKIGVMGMRTVCGITSDQRFLCQEYGSGVEHEIRAGTGTKFQELSCNSGVCCAHDGVDAWCIDSQANVTRAEPGKDRSRRGYSKLDGAWVTTDEYGCYDKKLYFGMTQHVCISPVPPPDPAKAMGRFELGASHACTILTQSNKVHCWSDSGDASGAPQDAPLSGLTFGDLASGTQFSCGLTPAGASACWGQVRPDLVEKRDYTGKIIPPRSRIIRPIDGVVKGVFTP